MKKVILVFMVSLLISRLCLSQDIISLKTGEQIRTKILEIGQTEIKYKKFDNQNGPVYVVSKSDILQIVYENGTKDIFATDQNKVEISNTGNTKEVTETNTGPLTQESVKKSRFLIGFSGVLPTGTWPATALSNMGSTSFLKEQGHSLKRFGFGIMIQGKVTNNISLFFDINMYNYNILVGKIGEDVQTAWTVEEMATHWDEPDAPQIPYVHNLPTDVHFDMQTSGFRLGAKYIIGKKNIRPWIGAAFGYYRWDANYFNEDKTKTYGKDNGYVAGLTYLAGIDFEVMSGIVITPFADLASPVAKYKMEGLFYPQWDIEYDSPIMGTSRFGLSISFSPAAPSKR